MSEIKAFCLRSIKMFLWLLKNKCSNVEYLISRDLLKQRHIKNQERFIASLLFSSSSSSSSSLLPGNVEKQ